MTSCLQEYPQNICGVVKASGKLRVKGGYSCQKLISFCPFVNIVLVMLVNFLYFVIFPFFSLIFMFCLCFCFCCFFLGGAGKGCNCPDREAKKGALALGEASRLPWTLTGTMWTKYSTYAPFVVKLLAVFLILSFFLFFFFICFLGGCTTPPCTLHPRICA